MAITAGAAVWAAATYRAQNQLHAFNNLVEQELGLLGLARQYPYLATFFVDFGSDLDPAERADRSVQLIVKDDYDIRPWRDVPDLLCLIYEEADFHKPAKQRLRKALILAQQVLYLLSNAQAAMKKGLLEQEEFDDWSAYLNDIGRYPLFLAAVHCWHALGYLSTDLAHSLHAVLTRFDSRHRRTLEIIYREMLEEQWPTRVGLNPELNCPCGRIALPGPASLQALRTSGDPTT